MTSTHPLSSGTIVVGVDGSPESEHAVRWAADEARLENRGLTLVHAEKVLSSGEASWYARVGVPRREIENEIRRAAERVMERAQALAADRSRDTAIHTFYGRGDARRLLLDLSATSSMVVVGTRGHGRVVGLLMGSVSGALVRHSEAPVAVVRPSEGATRGVLIGADGSEASLPAVEHAYREASQRGLPLTVAHCLWDGLIAQARWTAVSDTDPEGVEAHLRIAESIAGMTEKFPDVDVRIAIARGTVDAFLVDMSKQHDLLVIGRPPLSLGQRLTLSGLTTSIAEHAHSAVLVVP